MECFLSLFCRQTTLANSKNQWLLPLWQMQDSYLKDAAHFMKIPKNELGFLELSFSQ